MKTYARGMMQWVCDKCSVSITGDKYEYDTQVLCGDCYKPIKDEFMIKINRLKTKLELITLQFKVKQGNLEAKIERLESQIKPL